MKVVDFIDGIKCAPTVTVVYGDEPQLIEECRVAVKAVTTAASGERADWETLPDSPMTEKRGNSLFGDGSCLYEVAGHGAPGVRAAAALLKLAQRMKAPDVLMVAVYHLERKHYKAAWLRELSMLGQSLRAERLNAADTAVWCRRWCVDYALNMNAETVQWLASQTEGNLAAAKQCLFKMHLAGDTPEATPTASALSDGARYNVFNLVDAALMGQGRRALAILQFLLETQEPPPLILWAISNAIQSVLAVKKGGNPAWGLPAPAVRDLARRVAEEDIKRLMYFAVFADRAIKGVGGGDVKIHLMNLIVKLATWRRGVKISVPNILL